jgi:hypothetical protein
VVSGLRWLQPDSGRAHLQARSEADKSAEIRSLTLFEKMPILQALSQSQSETEQTATDNRLKLL